MIACTVFFMGAVLADQVEDTQDTMDGTSLLQVSITAPPLPVEMGEPLPAKPGRKGGTLRAVCEMLFVVLAVVFWSQLKESVWPSAPEKPKEKAPVSDEAWRGAMLHESVRNNDVEMLKKHAVNGDVDFRDNLDRTPLHVAATLGWRECSEQLLAFGANHSARDFDDTTPCMMAGRKGHREVVRLLLDAGAVVGGRDEDLPPCVAQELMGRLLR